MRKIIIATIMAVLTAASLTSAVSASSTVNAQYIGNLGRGDSMGNSINENSVIAGTSPNIEGNYRGFTWNGTLQDLGILGVDASQNITANDINDAGVVVGAASFISGHTNAYIKTSGNNFEAIPLLPGMINGYATAINNANVVVGYNTDYDNHTKAFIYVNGVVSELPSLGGGYTIARDLNEKGQIVGVSQPVSGPQHAVLWQDGVTKDLGSLNDCSEANSINEKGQIVGTSDICNKASARPTLWSGNEIKALPIDTLTSGAFTSYAYATSINDNGNIVGYGKNMSEVPFYNKGLLWNVNTALPMDLFDTSIVKDAIPQSINNKGEITGVAYWSYTNGNSSYSESGAFYAQVDVTAPTVSIVTPTSDTKLLPRSKAQFAVSATDNVRVEKVELYYNDTLLCTINNAPYACVYDVPTPNISYTLTAKATDTSGNAATSAIFLNVKKNK